MQYKIKYSKEEAIETSKLFLEEVRLLEEKYSISFNSDINDIYLTFKNDKDIWSSVKIGWKGDGTGLSVMEKSLEDKKQEILSKLSNEEKEILGL